MKVTAIIASAAAFIAATSQADPLVWSNCATYPTIVTDASFNMDGEWSCLGKKVCGTLTGNLESPIIEGAKLSVTAKYLGRHTGYLNGDLCAILAESGYNCPIPAGPKTFHACINWNGVTPNVGATVKMVANNGDGLGIFCQTTPSVMNKNCTLTPNP